MEKTVTFPSRKMVLSTTLAPTWEKKITGVPLMLIAMENMRGARREVAFGYGALTVEKQVGLKQLLNHKLTLTSNF